MQFQKQQKLGKGQQAEYFQRRNKKVCQRNQQLSSSLKYNALPQHPEQVVLWAREEFENEVRNFGTCGLAKMCLLIALEDEAALNMEYKDVARFLNMGVENESRYQYLGTKATWNLSRLDALAEEVKAALELEQSHTHNMPLTTVQAVNEVLYTRHGYRRKNRIRDPNRAQFHCVMEEGQGTPATLAVLYIEVCRRLGFSLSAQVMDEGYYVLLRPQNIRLGIQKTELLIDPYDKGFLHDAQEICQLFEQQDLSGESDPVGGKSLVASVLLELRDAYWSISLGCAEHPALVPSISLDTVLANKAYPEAYDFFRERALAACERRALLFPKNYALKQEAAIMQYLCGQFDSAWIEMAEIIEKQQITPIEREKQKSFLEKLRLIIDEENNHMDYKIIA